MIRKLIILTLSHLETTENMGQITARVLKQKPPKTEIIYDMPPEDEHPAAYPLIKDPKKITIGMISLFIC